MIPLWEKLKENNIMVTQENFFHFYKYFCWKSSVKTQTCKHWHSQLMFIFFQGKLIQMLGHCKTFAVVREIKVIIIVSYT